MLDNMLVTWVSVLGFGILGVGSRYAIELWIARSYPLHTFFVNLFGCFLAGVVFSGGVDKGFESNSIRLGLMVGFCGGFTTFSGYGLQFLQLMNAEKWSSAFAYGVGTPVFCTLATALGFNLFRLLN